MSGQNPIRIRGFLTIKDFWFATKINIKNRIGPKNEKKRKKRMKILSSHADDHEN